MIIGGFIPWAMAAETSRESFYTNGTYNALIGDADFVDTNAMSAADIQAFLESKNSYLAKHTENNRTAAQIIYDAAHGYGNASGKLYDIEINSTTGTVNPRILLVTLEKEQSLVTLTESKRAANLDSYNNRLNRAMGYGCPDTGGCNDAYKGFTSQVEWTAWQLRYNLEAAGQNQSWWDSHYKAVNGEPCRRQYILNTVCSITNTVSSINGWSPPGTTTVTLATKATAGLYRYTPHVFNGNYNFWYYMTTWFGLTAGSVTVASSNDTNDVSTKTYGSSVKISGSKTNVDLVFYNNIQIAGSGPTSWETEIPPDVGTKDYKIEYRDSNSSVIATKKVTIERRVYGDISGDDQIVELKDLSLLAQDYGLGVKDDDWRDLNSDNVVDILDLSKLAEVWP